MTNSGQLSFIDDALEPFKEQPRAGVTRLRAEQKARWNQIKTGQGPSTVKPASITLPNGSIIESHGLGLSGDEVRAITRTVPPPDPIERIVLEGDERMSLFDEQGNQIPWRENGELWM